MVVDEALAEAGVDEDARHWLGLALREGVANAIKHGNAQDPEKRVEVDLELQPGEAVLRIADEGTGFDPDEIKDPLAPENRFRADGRGIFYMRKFMDEVRYSFAPGGGTVLTLRKRFEPPGTVGTPGGHEL